LAREWYLSGDRCCATSIREGGFGCFGT